MHRSHLSIKLDNSIGTCTLCPWYVATSTLPITEQSINLLHQLTHNTRLPTLLPAKIPGLFQNQQNLLPGPSRNLPTFREQTVTYWIHRVQCNPTHKKPNIFKFITSLFFSKCYALFTLNAREIYQLSKIIIFQDFPEPNSFSRVFQGLENQCKNPRLCRRHGNPGIISGWQHSITQTSVAYIMRCVDDQSKCQQMPSGFKAKYQSKSVSSRVCWIHKQSDYYTGPEQHHWCTRICVQANKLYGFIKFKPIFEIC